MNGGVRDIAAAGDGEVWVGTERRSENGRLSRIDGDDGSVLGAMRFEPRMAGSPVPHSYGMLRHGDVLFAGSQGSLVAYGI
jgi:hypothetical protein